MLDDLKTREASGNYVIQDPRFPLTASTVSPGYHCKKPLYILPEITRRKRNSVDFGGLATQQKIAQFPVTFYDTGHASYRILLGTLEVERQEEKTYLFETPDGLLKSILVGKV